MKAKEGGPLMGYIETLNTMEFLKHFQVKRDHQTKVLRKWYWNAIHLDITASSNTMVNCLIVQLIISVAAKLLRVSCSKYPKSNDSKVVLTFNEFANSVDPPTDPLNAAASPSAVRLSCSNSAAKLCFPKLRSIRMMLQFERSMLEKSDAPRLPILLKVKTNSSTNYKL